MAPAGQTAYRVSSCLSEAHLISPLCTLVSSKSRSKAVHAVWKSFLTTSLMLEIAGSVSYLAVTIKITYRKRFSSVSSYWLWQGQQRLPRCCFGLPYRLWQSQLSVPRSMVIVHTPVETCSPLLVAESLQLTSLCMLELDIGC
jgi:hypothetical protein